MWKINSDQYDGTDKNNLDRKGLIMTSRGHINNALFVQAVPIRTAFLYLSALLLSSHVYGFSLTLRSTCPVSHVGLGIVALLIIAL